MEKTNDYEIYKGKPVRICCGNNNSNFGVVEKITQHNLYLKPSIIYESFPLLNGQTRPFARLEEKTSLLVNINFIESIEPLTEGYLEELIRRTNEFGNKIEGKQPRYGFGSKGPD